MVYDVYINTRQTRKRGERMKERKRELIKGVAKRINALPEWKKLYVLGIIEGMTISETMKTEQKAG